MLKDRSGFTLIEILVVLVILGVLASFIAPKIMSRPEEAKRTKAKLEIKSLETAIKMYKLDNGSYPSTEQGLEALVNPPSSGKRTDTYRQGGYIEKGKVGKDPWGTNYIYLSPGRQGDFDIISYGADGEPGGNGNDADISNQDIE